MAQFALLLKSTKSSKSTLEKENLIQPINQSISQSINQPINRSLIDNESRSENFVLLCKYFFVLFPLFFLLNFLFAFVFVFPLRNQLLLNWVVATAVLGRRHFPSKHFRNPKTHHPAYHHNRRGLHDLTKTSGAVPVAGEEKKQHFHKVRVPAVPPAATDAKAQASNGDDNAEKEKAFDSIDAESVATNKKFFADRFIHPSKLKHGGDKIGVVHVTVPDTWDSSLFDMTTPSPSSRFSHHHHHHHHHLSPLKADEETDDGHDDTTRKRYASDSAVEMAKAEARGKLPTTLPPTQSMAHIDVGAQNWLVDDWDDDDDEEEERLMHSMDHVATAVVPPHQATPLTFSRQLDTFPKSVGDGEELLTSTTSKPPAEDIDHLRPFQSSQHFGSVDSWAPMLHTEEQTTRHSPISQFEPKTKFEPIFHRTQPILQQPTSSFSHPSLHPSMAPGDDKKGHQFATADLHTFPPVHHQATVQHDLKLHLNSFEQPDQEELQQQQQQQYQSIFDIPTGSATESLLLEKQSENQAKFEPSPSTFGTYSSQNKQHNLNLNQQLHHQQYDTSKLHSRQEAQMSSATFGSVAHSGMVGNELHQPSNVDNHNLHYPPPVVSSSARHFPSVKVEEQPYFHSKTDYLEMPHAFAGSAHQPHAVNEASPPFIDLGEPIGDTHLHHHQHQLHQQPSAILEPTLAVQDGDTFVLKIPEDGIAGIVPVDLVPVEDARHGTKNDIFTAPSQEPEKQITFQSIGGESIVLFSSPYSFLNVC